MSHQLAIRFASITLHDLVQAGVFLRVFLNCFVQSVRLPYANHHIYDFLRNQIQIHTAL